MGEEHKEVVRRYFEAVGSGDLDALEAIFEADFVDHTAQAGQPAGLDGLREFFVMFRSAFPDFAVSADQLIAEGDLVAARFTFTGTHTGTLMDAPPSGNRVTMSGVDIFRLRGGRIAELWGFEDMLGLLRQIGALR